ncbi:MAG TPA: DMT family transporter [Kofleriaceae bacterium]|nr:DMT family transporter [Kofleriaceae bacterium]
MSALPLRVATRADSPPGSSGFVMVIAAAASWGTWSLFLRPTHLPAIATSPIIFLVMGLVALPLALRGPRARWDRTTMGLIAANALFDGLNVVAFFAAIQHTTIAIAVLTHYLAPILVALAAPRIDGVVTPGARPAAGIALGGLAIILEPWHAPASGALYGALCGVGSAICYAGNVFTVRRLVPRIGAARMQAYHSLIAGGAMAPLAAGHLGQLTPGHLGLLAAGAATIGAASGIAFSVGLARIGSARTAVLTFIEPVVAVAVGAVVWDEPLHPIALLGGVLVLGAGIQVARKAR